MDRKKQFKRKQGEKKNGEQRRATKGTATHCLTFLPDTPIKLLFKNPVRTYEAKKIDWDSCYSLPALSPSRDEAEPGEDVAQCVAV